MNNECPHCGEEDARHAPQDCRDCPWIEFTEEDEAGFIADEAEREFEHRLKLLTHGSYERVTCGRGTLVVSGPKGLWFPTLEKAAEWLKGWQV